MKRSRRFRVLIVRGDSVRALRFSVSSILVSVAVLLVLATGVGIGVLARDWWVMRQLIGRSTALLEDNLAQRRLLESTNRQIVELAREVATWRGLQTQMWHPFGPEAGRSDPGGGVGGTATALAARALIARTPLDALQALSRDVSEVGENLRAFERMIARASRALAALPSIWPVRGRVTSEFGARRSPWTNQPEFHGGIDIVASHGTPVRAPAAGTVVHASATPELGLAVMVDHGRDIRSVYGHLSKILVQSGQTVGRGTEVGVVGNTGRSSGRHLHYEIIVRGQAVDPRSFLWD